MLAAVVVIACSDDETNGSSGTGGSAASAGNGASVGGHGSGGFTGQCPAEPTGPAPALKLTSVASGLTKPLWVGGAPGDPASRLFILEQTGRVRIAEGGTVLSDPFLDISDLVSGGNEQGLLG